jgi:hydroxyacylglutathione hydrolase
LKIDLVPAFTDNYLFVGTGGDGTCFVVDPGDAAPVLALLAKSGMILAAILVTHHHIDHIGGVRELAARTGCKRIIGPAYDQGRITSLTELVHDSDHLEVCGMNAQVLFVPGHTNGHISYYFSKEKTLFCGDALFSVGCGRMFEGNKEQMWNSIAALRALPDDTAVYCAHEYTLANIRFALSVDPKNRDLISYEETCKKRRDSGLPTIPTSIGLEKKVNPFLKVDQPTFQSDLGHAKKSAAEVFGVLRRMKDTF